MRVFSSVVMLWLAAAVCCDAAQAAPEACDANAIRGALQAYLPGELSISPTPVNGLCEVAQELRVLYASPDGSYVLQGPLIDTARRLDLTAQRLGVARQALLAKESPLGTYDYLANTSPPAHTLTVITDIDCAYCRRLHANMDDYNAAGIELRYLMLPRAGRDSVSYKKAVAAACSQSPTEAITEYMNGAPLPQQPASCEHNIDRHMALAQRLGANSTPSFVFPDGTLTAGLMPPERLLQVLEASAE